MVRKPKVAVVGSANTDLVIGGDCFPRPGETVFGERFAVGFGGKGANQAVAARQCGADVAMIARVGSDLFGEATLRNFADFGIDTSCVRAARPGTATGAAAIFVESNGQNRIIVVKGANDELVPADIDNAAALLATVDVILVQLEVPLTTVYYTVRFAKERGIRCIVNPAAAAHVKGPLRAALPALRRGICRKDFPEPTATVSPRGTGTSATRTLEHR